MSKQDKVGEQKDNADAAGQQQAGDDVTADGQQDVTLAAEGNQDEEARLKAAIAQANDERDKRQSLEKDVESLRQQMQLMSANQANVASTPQAQQSERKNLFVQCAERLGYGDELYLTPAQHGEILEAMVNVSNQASAFQNFAQNHPDYAEVAGNVTPQGQFIPSAEVQKILIEKPHLRAFASNPQGAYEIVMQERQIKELSEKNRALEEQSNQNVADTKTNPIGSGAAGGGAVNKNQVMSVNATKEEVAAMEARVQAGEFEE